jgi:hypothetical protein
MKGPKEGRWKPKPAEGISGQILRELLLCRPNLIRCEGVAVCRKREVFEEVAGKAQMLAKGEVEELWLTIDLGFIHVLEWDRN